MENAICREKFLYEGARSLFLCDFILDNDIYHIKRPHGVAQPLRPRVGALAGCSMQLLHLPHISPFLSALSLSLNVIHKITGTHANAHRSERVQQWRVALNRTPCTRAFRLDRTRLVSREPQASRPRERCYPILPGWSRGRAEATVLWRGDFI